MVEPGAKKRKLNGESLLAPKLVKVATCNLNCWAMDFPGNLERVKASIRESKQQGCKFRTGPELELTGYNCEDHFLESDTLVHAWQSMANILDSDITDDILCDIGMPVMHRNVTYNCRVFVLNGQILGIRPKIYMANDGNYREMRWFSPWYVNPSEPNFGEVEDYFLPEEIFEICKRKGVENKQKGKDGPDPEDRTVKFGIFAIATHDTCIASETCEELFTPEAPNIKLALDGVEIIANGSGSHHQLRKLNKRIELVKGATSKGGGVYLYANMRGCDGGRMYHDGCCMVWVNGKLIKQGQQFGTLDEVEVVVATVNLDDVRTFRANFISRSYQASTTPQIKRITANINLCSDPFGHDGASADPEIEPHQLDAMEEIALGPSGWLWDYLRRSGQRGYFLPLSGGADSASTAGLVAIMCQRVVKEIKEGGERSKKQTLEDVRKITRRPDYTPSDHKDLCGKILTTCYMASEHSGSETTERAKRLAAEIGANHTAIAIKPITDSIVETFKGCRFYSDALDPAKVKSNPSWDSTGQEDIALQNIQARSRMVMAYFMAQLMPWATDKANKDEGPGWGSLLVLGSANVDEALRGYYTKYDCSAADINPIGGINKRDLKAFLVWAAKSEAGKKIIPIKELNAVAVAVPTAELRPTKEEDGKKVEEQSDEKDMGMSYDELGDLGYLRKVDHCGPLSTFLKLRNMWKHKTEEWKSPEDNKHAITPSIRVKVQPKTFDEKVAQKVKDFFFFHAINRHKMTTLTPSYHAENYSPDDNRFDLRPFLFPAAFEAQFQAIDDVIASYNS